MEQGIEFERQAMPHVILEGGFSLEDVFNMDETCLFFKARLSKTLCKQPILYLYYSRHIFFCELTYMACGILQVM